MDAAEFENAGLVLEEMEFIRCRSKCVFCFVDQMPAGLRPSLYVKDDDYRLSFLFGNFITLMDLDDREIERIIEMNLSPLYVSIHAIDEVTRNRLFGRRSKRDVIRIVGRLAQGGITIHAQIVLLPGINDGAVLEETVRVLYGFYPECRSLAIVPVGLTGHRRDLVHLDPVTPEIARSIIGWAGPERARMRKDTGSECFLHLADEFYLMSGEDFPPAEEYDGYPQIANGVGMCRSYMDEIECDITALGGAKRDSVSIGVVTGTLGEAFLEKYILPIVSDHAPWIEIELIVVDNDLFGGKVNVSGLLAGRDIVKAVNRSSKQFDRIVLPPNCINHDGLLIDDTTPDDISRETGRLAIVPEGTFLGSDVLGSIGE
jgi:putative radical SAM enzyme (TIGR03279 family)